MGYVQKRLASTAAKLAHASPSQAPAFPPKEAIASTSSKTEFFDAQTWAALQPPPKSELTAFAHRIGLGHIRKSPGVIQQACTHPSFVPFFRQHLPDEPIPETNGNLATLGNSLLGLFATEYIHSSYPHLPTRVLMAAVSAYVGPSPCEAIAKEMGATPLLRWHRMPITDLRPAVSHSEALSSIPRALTALVHQHRSVHSAREFVETFFLSRDVDLRSMIKFSDPKLALVETVAKFGRERPISRLLKETGRHSNSPIYVVGVYSGADQLGEGFGSSLKMAEFRAAEDALRRLYLTRQPPDSVQLPTSTFPSGEGSIFVAEEWKTHYVPVEMGDSEVHYASSGRSKAQSPGRRASAEDENDVDT
ncbi:60S ribosomal protein L3 [Laetiporus sulphureus 93-53]|uniref:Large ribosomal subunit protein mL44 n=1 Tax=Laetiporus sulphureus 93-53 TaxID=1314785 RepID=A0A165GAH8_9APHY|nr:60S ribosomal protein L3 [Laetiporus sulphureus 93-53]KZT10070.1 60S ribosomal protein L3 [Laetiporus sulphureus 93-53]